MALPTKTLTQLANPNVVNCAPEKWREPCQEIHS